MTHTQKLRDFAAYKENRTTGNVMSADELLDAADSYDGLVTAAKRVLAGLEARIEAARSTGVVPVFDGIADLHDAINKAEAD